MNQSMNTDSKNSKEPQQKYRLGTVKTGFGTTSYHKMGRQQKY